MRGVCPRCEAPAMVRAGSYYVCEACGYETADKRVWYDKKGCHALTFNRHAKERSLFDGRPLDGGRVLPVFLDEEGE